MTSCRMRVVSDMRAVKIHSSHETQANRNLKKVRMVGEPLILKIAAKCFPFKSGAYAGWLHWVHVQPPPPPPDKKVRSVRSDTAR